VHVLEHDTTLVALFDLADVVLVAFQRGDRAVVDFEAVTQESDLVVPDDLAVGNVAAGDRADTGDLEDIANLDRGGDLLLLFGVEETFEGRLDLVDDLVDNPVGTYIDPFGLGE